jgi:hypothetical protein
MNTNKDRTRAWEPFDEIAQQIKDMSRDYHTWHAERMLHYGNKMFITHGMISGHTWPNWSPEDRKTNRDYLNKINEAKDAVLDLKPARIHKRTALNRLRCFLEP